MCVSLVEILKQHGILYEQPSRAVMTNLGMALASACGKHLSYTRASWKDEKPLEECAPAHTLLNASVTIVQQNSLTNFLEVVPELAAESAPEPALELAPEPPPEPFPETC